MRTDALVSAVGKWPSILASLGVPDSCLTGKHSPCPMCGGKDRFRMISPDGKMSWICNQCGSGDGMDLACLFLKMDFARAIELVKPLVSLASYATAPRKVKPADINKLSTELMSMWRSAKETDIVNEYLASRGLPEKAFAGSDLRGANIDYWDEGSPTRNQPAMIARVVTVDSKTAALHKTYISQKKKKLSKTTRAFTGGAIRLFKPGASEDTLIVSEGIETALSARWLWYLKHKTMVPCWATISADGMTKFGVPKWVKNLLIFADNDWSFTGQSASYQLANRAAVRGKIGVEVFVPPETDKDWNDVLVGMRK